METIVTNARKM